MNEKEMKIAETIVKALPNMSEFDKGYFLGKSESWADAAKEKAKEGEQDAGEA